ncbi:MAG: hypothetical protein Sapg2KO_13810 [Saprospiraceae bacterium]
MKNILTLITVFLLVSNFPFQGLAQDGSIDPSFFVENELPMPDLATVLVRIEQMIVQPDDKILIAGNFYLIGDVPRGNVARLNPDGTLDLSFNLNVPSTEQGRRFPDALALQADGKILVSQNLLRPNDWNDVLERLNPDGSIDPSFDIGTGPNPGTVFSLIKPLSNGKIIIYSSSLSIFNGVPVNRTICLNNDGSLDESFNAAGVEGVRQIIEQADGKLILVGNYTPPGQTQRYNVFRLNADGSIDNSFLPESFSGVTGTLLTIAQQSDGKIIIGGRSTNYNGVPISQPFRIHPDGRLDENFNLSSPFRPLIEIKVSKDDKILVFGTKEGITTLQRLNSDGSMDDAFEVPRTLSFRDIACQSNGKILVSGILNGFLGLPLPNPGFGTGTYGIARLNNTVLRPEGLPNLSHLNKLLLGILLLACCLFTFRLVR